MPFRPANTTNNGPIDADIWSLVDRRPGLPDVILPSLCPSPCLTLFKAQPVNISGTECACRCSSSSPAFIQSYGHCSNQVDECQHPIRFQGSIDSSSVPLFTLPTPQSVIAPTASLKWEEASVKLIPSVGVRCNLTAVYYLKDDRIWQEASPRLFFIGWSNNDARIIWNGTTLDARHLEGTVIQLKLDCFGSRRNAHCVSFRIAGQTGPLIASRSDQMNGSHQGRLETIVIILLAILLFLSIFGSIILWNVCWGLKKSELISSIQMHILYQMRQDKEKEASEAAHRYQAISRGNMAEASKESVGMEGNQEMLQPVTIKRKLFFSAEFFEPHLMVNPPPIAEQFLHDLRKMIEIAKQRISLRRHVPQLVSIPEENKEHYEPYMELDEKHQDLRVKTPEHSMEEDQWEENSPKSTKSNDSGRESMRDASSIKSVASSTDSAPRQARSPVPPLGNGGVKNLVNDFEKVKHPEQPGSKKPTSKIPVISGFAKSPRLPVKSTHISAVAPKDYAEAPPLPPRNTTAQSKVDEGPPPLPNFPPPPRPSTLEGAAPSSSNNNNNGRRKTYAVFPTDPMLKKSLPRRTKKKPPSPVNGSIETNM